MNFIYASGCSLVLATTVASLISQLLIMKVIDNILILGMNFRLNSITLNKH